MKRCPAARSIVSSPGLLRRGLLVAALLAAGCDGDPGTAAPPTLPIDLTFPAGEDFASLDVRQVKVSILGEDLKTAIAAEFPVDDTNRLLGQLPIVPFSSLFPRTVVVEGYDADGELVARGSSLPTLTSSKEAVPTLHVLLAPVDRFLPTTALTDAQSGSPTMHVPRVGHSVTLLLDGRIMVAGGLHLEPGEQGIEEGELLDSIEVFEPRTGLWYLAEARLAIPRAYHTATLLRGKNGKVILLGGYGRINQELVTLAPGEWLTPSKLPDDENAIGALETRMIVPRARHTATAVDDWVLIAGGERLKADGTRSLVAELELFFASPPPLLADHGFCPSGKVWTFCNTSEMLLQHGRILHGATRVGDQVLIFGGSDGSVPLASSEYFAYDRDGASLPGRTSRGPSLQVARQGMAWVNLGDLTTSPTGSGTVDGEASHLYLFGGEGLSGDTLRALDSIEWYSPVRDLTVQFQLLDASIGRRTEAAAALVGQRGWILVAGGRSDADTPLATAKLLQVGSTGLVASPVDAGRLLTARYAHQLSPLANGQVLVSGGAGCDEGLCSSLADSELYNPGPEALE